MIEQSVLLKESLPQNGFANLLNIEAVELEVGRVKLAMSVVEGKHTNPYNMAHGGALASLADTAMGMVCVTVGKRVVTLDMNINFIRGAVSEAVITAVGTLIHNGNRTMVAEANLFDNKDNLIAIAKGTFFVNSPFINENISSLKL